MASPTGIDLAGGIEILNQHRMPAGIPLIVRRVVTTTANGAGELNAWPHGGIIRIGSVIAGRPVAILALDFSELRGCARADEPGGKAVTHGVTREALRILILLLIYQRRERLRMKSKKHSVVSRL